MSIFANKTNFSGSSRFYQGKGISSCCSQGVHKFNTIHRIFCSCADSSPALPDRSIRRMYITNYKLIPGKEN